MKVEELRELLKAASPAPWRLIDDGFHAGITTSPIGERFISANVCGGDAHEGYFTGPDADLIVAMRNRFNCLLDLWEAASLLRYASKKCSEPLYDSALQKDLEIALERLEAVE